MGDWISDLLIFSAGIAGGILIAHLIPYLRGSKRRAQSCRRRERAFSPTSKSNTIEEILQEAFRTTEAIRGELDKSLQTLRKTVTTVLDPVTEPHERRERPDVIQLSRADRIQLIDFA